MASYIEVYVNHQYFKIGLKKYNNLKKELKCAHGMFPGSLTAKFYYNGDRKNGYIRHLSMNTYNTLRKASM